MTRVMPSPFIQRPAEGRIAAWTSLVAAAVETGRLPGEPPVILPPLTRPSLLTRMIGTRRRGPLADPRLEVLRAISASLAKGVAQIGDDLLAAAHRVGWTSDDLRRTFPGALVGHSLP
jgi:hypothetical protein